MNNISITFIIRLQFAIKMLPLGVFISNIILAQSPISEFKIPENACKFESIEIENNSINGSKYVWDFSEGDLFQLPTFQNLGTIEGSSSPKSIDIANFEDQWYGFITSKSTNSLLRIEFGEDLDNPTPIISNLGNIGGLLSGPEPIKIISEGGLWYAFIINGANSNLLRLSFGTSLLNFPEAEVVLNNFSIYNSGFDIGEMQSQKVLIASNFITNKITLVNFGNSITNNPTQSDIKESTTIDGAAGSGDIKILHEHGIWYGFLIAPNSRKLFRLDFGNNLFSIPIFTDITGEIIGSEITYGIEISRDKGEFVGFLQTFSGKLIRIFFGNTLSNNIPESEILSGFEVLQNNVSLKLVKNLSQWHAFTLDVSNRILFGGKFPNPGSPNSEISNAKKPTGIIYNEPGKMYISLSALNNQNELDYSFDSITVSGSLAPSIKTKTTGNCLTSPIHFDGISLYGTIESWNWDFGDGMGTSNLQNDSYIYGVAGDYEVKLNVSDANGCNNFFKDTVRVFEEPSADFSILEESQCTNTPVSFINTTTGETGPIIEWNWNINNEATYKVRDTSYTFTTGGDKNITLSASIPGCSSEISKLISITPGPLTSFDFDGTCAYDDFAFLNSTTGVDITAYQWDFGDGYFSSNTSPNHRYESGGSYPVGLTATNALGCNTTLQKVVSVGYIPSLIFSNDLACSDNSVTFFDQSSVTDANITSRSWILSNSTIGYMESATGQSPTFLLNEDGTYEMSLISQSNYGCQDTLFQLIDVLKSPKADFTIDNTCFGDSVLFAQNVSLPVDTYLANTDWLIDGQLYSGDEVNHTFLNPGTYDVEFYVRASNLCPDDIKKSPTINPLPEIDFDLSANCEDQLVAINSHVQSPMDPVNGYSWLINNKPTSNQENFQYEFKKAEDYDISLQVSTENNCSNSVVKNISIYPSPVAKFDVYPFLGASPLIVQFTDRSQGADTLLYHFSHYNEDGSSEENPSFTYYEIGKDLATQIAKNKYNCADTAIQPIEVVVPVYDITLAGVSVDVMNTELKLKVGIQNNGTIIINNPVVRIDVAEKVSINHKIETALMPSAFNEYMIDFEVLKRTNEPLDYICFSLEQSYGDKLEDVTPFDNNQCISIDNAFNVLDPFPNPSSQYVDVPVILPNVGDCDFKMVGEQGDIVYTKQFANLNSGLNVIRMDLAPYRKGFYLLTVKLSESEITKKIVIQ